jgi:hypothetical protein
MKYIIRVHRMVEFVDNIIVDVEDEWAWTPEEGRSASDVICNASDVVNSSDVHTITDITTILEANNVKVISTNQAMCISDKHCIIDWEEV